MKFVILAVCCQPKQLKIVNANCKLQTVSLVSLVSQVVETLIDVIRQILNNKQRLVRLW